MNYDVGINKYLRPGRLIRLVFEERYGEAHVSFTSGGRAINMYNLKCEIYQNLKAVEWERFKITTVRTTETGMVVCLERV